MANRRETLAAVLAGQGFGSRKACEHLVRNGMVEIGTAIGEKLEWTKPADPDQAIHPANLHFRVEDLTLPYQKELHIVLHKLSDTECSHSPSHHRSIFDLLPKPFLLRGLQAVGRLDADSTGLLLLSDSGAFNHFFTSPRRHVAKTYRVGAKHAITSEQKMKMEAGVELRSEDGITLPTTVNILDEKNCDMTLEEGKYHQIKRMFSAVGNRVESIHRIAIGAFRLEESLAPGTWRILTGADLSALGYKGV